MGFWECFVTLWFIGLSIMIGACASSTQPAVRAEADVDQTADVRAVVQAEIQPVVAAVNNQEKRVTEAIQQGNANRVAIDNSNADKVVNRLLAVSLGLVALTYPLGKAGWLVAGRLFRRKGRGSISTRCRSR